MKIKKRDDLKLLGISYLICCIITVFPFALISNNEISHAALFSCFLILMSTFTFKYFNFKNKILDKENMYAIVLTVLFLLMLPLFQIIKLPVFNYTDLTNRFPIIVSIFLLIWAYLLYLPTLIFATYVNIRCILHGLINIKKHDNIKKYDIAMSFLFIEFASLICLFSTYPGIWIQDDVTVVYNTVLNNEWNDWHTFGYLLFVKLCINLFNSTFAVNLIQTLIWSILNIYILYILYKHIKVKWSLYTYTVGIILLTSPLVYLEVMYKDVVFTMGIFSIVVCLWKVIHTNSIDKFDFFIAVLIGAFATLCRHAGVISVVCSLIVVGIYMWFKKERRVSFKIFAILGIHIMLFFIVNTLLYNSMNVIENPKYVKYGMPMAMIGAAVVEGVEFDAEDIETLEKVMPIEEWGNCYNKYWVDDIARSWGKIGGRIFIVQDLVENQNYGLELLKINAKLVLRHPMIYLKSFFTMNSLVWEICDPPNGLLWPIALVTENENIYYTSFYKLTGMWAKFTANFPLYIPFAWRGGLSLFTLIMCFSIFSIKKKFHYIMAFLPIVLNTCMLFITIPAQDPRYVLPAIECALFGIVIIPTCTKSNLSKKIEINEVKNNG